MRKITFSDKDINFMRSNPHLTERELADMFDVSKSVITRNKKEYGITIKGPIRGWGDDELLFLRNNRIMPSEKIADALGRSPSAVVAKRNALKLGKISHCNICGEEVRAESKRCKKHKKSSDTLKSYKSKCKKSGKEFSISDAEFVSMLDKPCEYCGEDATGLDRVDNARGYSNDNVVPCCGVCNVMKNDLTLAAFEDKIRKIAQRLEKSNG
ncbi:HNH endonuclease [bacterium]|nr:HNH endonuclease [bacterium]